MDNVVTHGDVASVGGIVIGVIIVVVVLGFIFKLINDAWSH